MTARLEAPGRFYPPKKVLRPDNFLGGKTDNRDVDERGRSNLTGLRRKAAEKTPYPYFLERLEEIDAWLKAGFSVRNVWQIYSDEPVPFPGSYRSFLRYCRKHCRTVTAVEPKAVKAPEQKPGRVGSVLGQGKRYPPPPKRPPGLTPAQIEAMMDPDCGLEPTR